MLGITGGGYLVSGKFILYAGNVDKFSELL